MDGCFPGRGLSDLHDRQSFPDSALRSWTNRPNASGGACALNTRYLAMPPAMLNKETSNAAIVHLATVVP